MAFVDAPTVTGSGSASASILSDPNGTELLVGISIATLGNGGFRRNVSRQIHFFIDRCDVSTEIQVLSSQVVRDYTSAHVAE